jgi:predicted negative regulator of RcsB-dependent stress response
LTRHELKEQLQHDQFQESVAGALNYATSHKQRIIQWGILAGIVAIVIGVFFWISAHRRTLRQQDLQAAMAVVDAQVGPSNEYVKTFATQDEKLKASIKALRGISEKYTGTKEGFFAQYYLGTLESQNNDQQSAEKDLRAVASSSSESSALAKIALAQIYIGMNRTSDAQNLLKELVNKPTDLVSKGQAEILLAQLDSKSNPTQAKKVLDRLKASKEDPAVARAADQVAAQLTK